MWNTCLLFILEPPWKSSIQFQPSWTPPKWCIPLFDTTIRPKEWQACLPRSPTEWSTIVSFASTKAIHMISYRQRIQKNLYDDWRHAWNWTRRIKTSTASQKIKSWPCPNENSSTSMKPISWGSSIYFAGVIKLIDMFSTIHQFISSGDNQLEGMDSVKTWRVTSTRSKSNVIFQNYGFELEQV